MTVSELIKVAINNMDLYFEDLENGNEDSEPLHFTHDQLCQAYNMIQEIKEANDPTIMVEHVLGTL